VELLAADYKVNALITGFTNKLVKMGGANMDNK
jgi:hypothetical protein